MSAKISINGILRVFSHRNYAIFAAGNFGLMSGEWVQRVGVGWLTWELTHSATWLGVIACADMIPAIFVSPIAGTYADRMDRLRFMRWSVGLSIIQPLLLTVLFFTGILDIWLLLLLALYNGTLGAFKQSAWHTIIPYLVDRSELPTAVALGSTTYNLSRFAGPAIAGVLIASAGAGYSFVANLVTHVGFLFGLLFIVLKNVEAPRARTGNVFTETIEGIRYTARHPGIGPLMLLLVGSSVGQRPFIDLLPGFASDVFARGPEALGWMVSMVGLGALIGALYLAMRPSLRGQSAIAIHAVLLSGIMLLAFAASREFWVAMVCLLVAGSSLSLSGVGVMTLVQAAVDGSMRGRVLSLYGVIFRAGPALGALVMGLAAEYVGLRWPVAVGAGICVLFWAITYRRLPQIAKVIEQDSAAYGSAASAPVAKAGE